MTDTGFLSAISSHPYRNEKGHRADTGVNIYFNHSSIEDDRDTKSHGFHGKGNNPCFQHKGEQITQPHCLELGGNVRNRRGDVDTRIGIYDPGASLHHGLRHLENRNDEIKGMVNDDSRCRRLERPFEKHEGVDVVHIVLIDDHADEFVGQDSGYDKPRYGDDHIP